MNRFPTLLATLLIFVSSPLSAQTLILTSDKQLRTLANHPDEKIDNTTGLTKNFQSLADVVNEARRQGSEQITVAFDEFFRQYRDDRDVERRLTPDQDEYVELMARISRYVERAGGMGLELSLLSPLELGQAFRRQTGQPGGRWIAFKVGSRNALTGRWSVNVWQQTAWNNNKGATPVNLVGVRAYAFQEQSVSPFKRAVDPETIRPLSDVHFEVIDSVGTAQGVTPQRRLRVFGQETGQEERVLVLIELESQEMDYFSAEALPFLKGLMKKYHDAGVRLTSLYSDEMHIQQDWNYFAHHDDGQFTLRYFTPATAAAWSAAVGRPLDERFLLYFVSQPPLFEPRAQAIVPVEYVLAGGVEAIHQTYLLRDKYYRLLNNHVVDLFVEAKAYGEQLYGHPLRTAAHASWAESPTIDLWNLPRQSYAACYEYTPDFLWSNTVHQAAAACYDYFKWGEYLSPTGNDFCESGWLDRDYYGAAMAASIGVINAYPNAYAAAWGMPAEAYERRMAVNFAFGCYPPPFLSRLTENATRDVDVLMLYPMNLVSVSPRFGSWLTQYGYANYLTSDQLVRRGHIVNGRLQVGTKRYGTLVALFEPLPPAGLLEMMERFVNEGGRVVWLCAPPLIDQTGTRCEATWQRLFGASYSYQGEMGDAQPGRIVHFCGSLEGIAPQTILTDFLVDRTYAVTPAPDAEVVATVLGRPVGVRRSLGHGEVCFLGFRPRDDQSQSLGYEERTLYEVLHTLGAYPPSGLFHENDNPVVVSRTTPYFTTPFPNGLTVVARHYRTHVENWPGGFSRDADQDAEILHHNPLPSDSLCLRNLAVNGHRVSYDGRLLMAFATHGGRLSSFYGQRCSSITVDGRRYTFSDSLINDISFGPVDGDYHHYQVLCHGANHLVLPVDKDVTRVSATIADVGTVPCRVRKGKILLTLSQEHFGRTIDLVMK